jgi:hypothetical protein
MIRQNGSFVAMRLIDFESLTKNRAFCMDNKSKNAFHITYDGSVISSTYSYLKFVCWQSVLVAHCWLHETSYKEFAASKVVKGVKNGEDEMWKGFNNLEVTEHTNLCTIIMNPRVTTSEIRQR